MQKKELAIRGAIVLFMYAIASLFVGLLFVVVLGAEFNPHYELLVSAQCNSMVKVVDLYRLIISPFN